jgi:hypothetical protein
MVKALTAVAEADRIGGQAVYWMADEDHDRLEVARTVAMQGDRLVPHTFRFSAGDGTATGWLPWTPAHQREAEGLWGPLPEASEPTLRGHVLALGAPLWRRGLRPFSPTDPAVRQPIQPELERWRALDLETDLVRQAERLERQGATLGLDPRGQAAWFTLDPRSGLRRRLEPGAPCPAGCWLSPGAALRPLMQSLLLPAIAAVVLGPAEREYWRLTEPLWERVGLAPPRIIPRPSVQLLPRGLDLDPAQLDGIRRADWGAFLETAPATPSRALPELRPDPSWPAPLARRFEQELGRTRQRLRKLDQRLARDLAGIRLGGDPERLRQRLFPLGRAQERVLPGWFWLRDEALVERILTALRSPSKLILLEEA